MIPVGSYKQIRLKLTSSSSYDPDMRCEFTVNTGSGSQLMVYFKDIDIEYSSGCQTDYLELHDGSSLSNPTIAGGKKCGSVTPYGVYRTTGSYLTFYFKSGGPYRYHSGFDMIITSYHTGACHSSEYDCDNGRCIADSLTCNGNNPCGDHSDCEGLTVGGIAGVVIGGIAFTIIIIVIVVVCRRRRVLYVQRGPPVATVTASSYGYNQPTPQQYGSPPAYQQY